METPGDSRNCQTPGVLRQSRRVSFWTNAKVTGEAGEEFLKEASKVMAAGTGKPERYVMVKIEDGLPMVFAGTDEATAFLEVRSIGYPADGVKGLTRSLCELVTRHLGVRGDRIYVVFGDIKGAMWGMDGETFG
jgi:phenylpyruvate tautomerase PptA (4-oxalocrotonate tautomerase family)